MKDKTAIEKAREALELAREAMAERRAYCEQWEYKYGREWDEEDAAIKEALSALDAEKPAEDAEAEANDLLETIEDHDSDFWETEISDLDGITTKVINVEKATSMLCQFAESYHSARCKEESDAILAASDRLGAALEESDKRR